MSHMLGLSGIPVQDGFLCSSYKILNRHQAECRMSRLAPGTDEYGQLQSALLRTSGIVEVSLPHLSYKVNTFKESERLLGGFGSSEHVAIGEAVKLHGLGGDDTLLLKGTCQLKFPHIVALAGDFYGVAGEAISLPGGEVPERTARFQKAFDTLVKGNNDEVRRVLLEIEGECTAVKHSALPHHCYCYQMLEKNRAIKKIKPDIDDLLIDNSDHFSSNARDAYLIGHALAVDIAREAGKKKVIAGLRQAYATDAFACHFLTDLFAAGHTRNQRGELEKFLVSELKFSPKNAKPLAGILTGAQHQKDGDDGLNVKNGKDDFWRAYGDGHFFSPRNEENKAKVIEATRASVDEVYQAYSNPDIRTPSKMVEYFPDASECLNPFPLYAVKNNGKELVLYAEGGGVPITTPQQYVSQAILKQALRYLPEEYVQGFLAPFDIVLPKVFEKVINPLVERITGVIWHTVGIATFTQVKIETKKISSQIDELSSIAKAAYENSEKILSTLESMDSKLKQMDSKLTQLVATTDFSELKEAIVWIRDATYLHTTHQRDGLITVQREEIEKKLSNAYARIARIFTSGSVGVQNIFFAYRSYLKAVEEGMSELEIKIALTSWFREMLDHEVSAFNLYALYAAARLQLEGKRDEILILQSQVPRFQEKLLLQLETNKDHIDPAIVCEPVRYIALQRQKSKVRRIAFDKILK